MIIILLVLLNNRKKCLIRFFAKKIFHISLSTLDKEMKVLKLDQICCRLRKNILAKMRYKVFKYMYA